MASARSAQEYLEQNRPRLEKVCTEALYETLQAQPQDPVAHMANKLLSHAAGKRTEAKIPVAPRELSLPAQVATKGGIEEWNAHPNLAQVRAQNIFPKKKPHDSCALPMNAALNHDVCR